MTEVNEPKDSRRLELTLLGCALTNPLGLHVISDLEERIFSDPEIKKCWSAVIRMYMQDGPESLQSVAVIQQRFETAGVAADRGLLLITEAMDCAGNGSTSVATAAREELLGIVMCRQIGKAGQNLLELARSNMNADEMAAEAGQAVAESIRVSVRVEIVEMSRLMDREIERMESDNWAEEQGYKTGITELDSITGGFHPGELIIIGARPSVGKSAFLNHIAIEFSAKQKLPGVVFSLEMPAEQYVQRIICNAANLDVHKARTRVFNPDERANYINTATGFRDMPCFIPESSGITLPRIQATTTRLVNEAGIKWLGVDYLQLMNHLVKSRENMNGAITRTSNGLKALATRLDIPVIVLSQLNRAPTQRDDKRPRSSDLRDSGSIEQDADVVIMLHRESMYWNAEKKADHKHDLCEKVELIVDKQRNGPTGVVVCDFQKKCAAFRNPIETQQVLESSYAEDTDFGGQWG